MLLAEVIPTGVPAGEGIGLNRGEYMCCWRCWVQLRSRGGALGIQAVNLMAVLWGVPPVVPNEV